MIVKVCSLVSVMLPASVLSQRKYFSTQAKAWGVKKGDTMKSLSHSRSWKVHWMTSTEHTALRFTVGVLVRSKASSWDVQGMQERGAGPWNGS